MATTLGSPTWGSGPSIPCKWTYDKRRSGANMQYRVYGYVNTDQATRYFGYYIDASVAADGTNRYSKRLKENSPSTWSSQYTFDTGWFTVSNKTSGTTSVTITLSTNAPRGASSWSYSMAVDPAGSSLSVTGSRILGQQQTLTLTRYSSSFTDSIRWTCGTSSGTIATQSTGTTFTFTPPISLASQNATGTSVQIQYTVSTYSGSSLVQSQTYTITYTIPDSVIPTATLAISDASGHLATYGAYIQGQSRLQIEITGTPAYGSPIASYSATADGTTFSGASITTPALQQTGQQTVSASVKDQRGRTSAAVAQNYTVLPYTTPQISKISAARCQQDGTHDPTGHYAVVDFSATVTPLNNINTADYTLKYKKTTDTTWTELALSAYDGQYSVTDGQVIFAADDDATYDIQLLANDDFGSMHLETSIPIAFALENWNLSGKGMAIGGISTKDALQVYMDAEFYADGNKVKGASLNDVVLECKNLLPYEAWKSVAIARGTAVWENNGVTLTATADNCWTQYGPAMPIGARIPVEVGKTYVLTWEETTDAAGGVFVFKNASYDVLAVVNNSNTKRLSFTVPSDVTFITYRFDVTNSGVTIAYKNIMLCDASITDDTFVPHAMTNSQITKKLDKLFLVRSYAFNDTTTYNIASQGTVWGNFAIPEIAGYTPIALRDWYFGGSVGFACVLYHVAFSKTVISTAWKNTTSTAGTVSFHRATVLYARDEFIGW